MRDRSERFHVVDDRGTAPESDDSREGRTDSRNTALAFQRFHQRRLFTHFIRACASMPVAVKLFVASENVLAQVAFGVGIGEGLTHNVDQVAVFAANVNKSDLRANGQTSDDHTLK